MRRLILPLLLLLSVTLIPIEAKAQLRAAASDRQAWNESLEIGPVPGLTTVWHAAPIETGIPLGETVQLRLKAGTWDPVEWTGAQEIERDGVYSVARVHIAHPGSQQVTVKATTRLGHERVETVMFHGIDLALTPLTLSPIQVSVDEIVIDPESPNASTMRYFFRPQSIAPLVTVGADHYRTSVNRWMTFTVGVQPTELAPLVEWTVNGEVLAPLGAQVELMVYGVHEHAIAAGGDAVWSPQVRLDTYSVRITEDTRDQRIVDGVPVTYRAETDPPGFESEVAWLASTKYGTCSPDRGTGPEFTTEFQGTLGNEGRWVGVRAANSSLGSDNKGASGIFRGPLETAEFSGTLVLDLREREDCLAGSWTVLNDLEQTLGSGIAIGDRSGQDVVMDLESLPNTVLVGTISANGDSITGTLDENGVSIEPILVLKCFGPNLVFEHTGFNSFPPASLCDLDLNGDRITVKNLGPGAAPATNVRGTLRCNGPGGTFEVEDNNNPVGPLAAGESKDFVLVIPDNCETVLSVSVTIDPVAGECNPSNNTASSFCNIAFPPVP